jgi:hypothetical protein
LRPFLFCTTIKIQTRQYRLNVNKKGFKMTILELKVKLAELNFLREQMELNQPDFFSHEYSAFESKLDKVIEKIVLIETAISVLNKIEKF